MKIDNLTINVTDISDALTLGNNSIVAEIFGIAEGIVKQGGKIILQRKYENTSPDLIAEFTTLEEVNNWKEKINEAQTALRRPEID